MGAAGKSGRFGTGASATFGAGSTGEFVENVQVFGVGAETAATGGGFAAAGEGLLAGDGGIWLTGAELPAVVPRSRFAVPGLGLELGNGAGRSSFNLGS